LYDEYCRRRKKLRTLKRVLAEISDDSEDGQSPGPTDSSTGVGNEAVGLTRESASADHSEGVDIVTIDEMEKEEVANPVITDVVSLNRPICFLPRNIGWPSVTTRSGRQVKRPPKYQDYE
jgi:hypothetical protein